MIPEKRFLNQIQQVLARLMQPLWLLDTEGTVLLPEENRSKINLPEFMEPGMPVAFEGKTFLMIGITPELILCAKAGVRGAFFNLWNNSFFDCCLSSTRLSIFCAKTILVETRVHMKQLMKYKKLFFMAFLFSVSDISVFHLQITVVFTEMRCIIRT